MSEPYVSIKGSKRWLVANPATSSSSFAARSTPSRSSERTCRSASCTVWSRVRRFSMISLRCVSGSPAKSSSASGLPSTIGVVMMPDWPNWSAKLSFVASAWSAWRIVVR